MSLCQSLLQCLCCTASNLPSESDTLGSGQWEKSANSGFDANRMVCYRSQRDLDVLTTTKHCKIETVRDAQCLPVSYRMRTTYDHDGVTAPGRSIRSSTLHSGPLSQRPSTFSSLDPEKAPYPPPKDEALPPAIIAPTPRYASNYIASPPRVPQVFSSLGNTPVVRATHRRQATDLVRPTFPPPSQMRSGGYSSNESAPWAHPGDYRCLVGENPAAQYPHVISRQGPRPLSPLPTLTRTSPDIA
ncbi:hypothetical protein C8Q79DRAFT_952051 [Trametes meyenii]|nr:hypothetical protein C8Q79DRAFT_952051 [Trametes meyenii]